MLIAIYELKISEAKCMEKGKARNYNPDRD